MSTFIVAKDEVLIELFGAARRRDERLGRFEARVNQDANAVEGIIKARFSEAKSQLSERVVPQVLEKPPEGYLHRTLGSRSANELRKLVERDIGRAFEPATGSYQPHIEVKYKSLKCETIRNSKFWEALQRLIPGTTIERMFPEHEVAPSESTRRAVSTGDRIKGER